MADILIPAGLLAFIALFAYALVSGARKQKRRKQDAYREFAYNAGLRYRETDDGTARAFAVDFDGIGRFESPSLGEVEPADLVTGRADGADLVLFRHRTRFYEGNAREWFVAGVRSADLEIERCAIQFLDGRVDEGSLYLADGIVDVQAFGNLRTAVRAPDHVAAGKALEPLVLGRLAELVSELPFLPEVQLRPGRVAVYPAGRNDNVDSPELLDALVRCARNVARICTSRA